MESSDVIAVSVPLSAFDLINTLSMMSRKEERKRKKKSRKPSPRPREEQAVIDKAKALLMERNHMTESEAHRYLQKHSMDNSTSLVETAHMILRLFLRREQKCCPMFKGQHFCSLFQQIPYFGDPELP